jgi:hypothetical protein
MAITSLALLVLAQKYRGNLTKQFNRRAATLAFLGIDSDAGLNCAWAFKGSGKTARAILEGAEATAPDQDAQWPATLNWGIYDTTFGITNLAAAAAMSSGGAPDENNDPFGEQLQEGWEAMSSLINQDLYLGDGSGGGAERTLVGFGEVFGSTTNTYAGLDRSSATYELLRPYVADPGSPTVFTLKMFRDDLAKIQRRCGVKPPVAFCQPLVFNMIAGRFDNIRRVEQYTTGKGTVTLDGSASVIDVDGCLVVEDKDAVYSGETDSVGSLTYVNPQYTRLKILPPGEVANHVMRQDKKYQLNDGYDNLMLNVKYEALAKTGSSEKARAELQLQLQCKRPNSGGVRKNIVIA